MSETEELCAIDLTRVPTASLLDVSIEDVEPEDLMSYWRWSGIKYGDVYDAIADSIPMTGSFMLDYRAAAISSFFNVMSFEASFLKIVEEPGPSRFECDRRLWQCRRSPRNVNRVRGKLSRIKRHRAREVRNKLEMRGTVEDVSGDGTTVTFRSC